MKHICFWFFVFSVVFFSTVVQSDPPSIAPADLPNSFTIPKAIPSGCMLVTPGRWQAPPEETFYDETVLIEDDFQEEYPVRVRVWRVGCHEPNRSAIMLNLEQQSNDMLLRFPMASLTSLESGQSPVALLNLFPGDGSLYTFGMTGFSLGFLQSVPLWQEGVTLVVDAIDSDDLSADDYNQDLVLTLDWGAGQVQELPVYSYVDDLDPPQMSSAPLHGRHTGQYVLSGMPSQGLVLQVGEIGTNRNYLFAVLFTYWEGEAFWVAGNVDFDVGNNEVEVEMHEFSGGEFFATDPGSYEQDDVEMSFVGTMKVRVAHCDKIEADIDFEPVGLGQRTLTFERLIDIAGYTCDATQ